MIILKERMDKSKLNQPNITKFQPQCSDFSILHFSTVRLGIILLIIVGIKFGKADSLKKAVFSNLLSHFFDVVFNAGK
jgi:hypothetical protein